MGARVKLGVAAAVFVMAAGGAHGHGNPLAVLDSFTSTSPGSHTAIAYAEAQTGKPYCWGGTGPGCYDCSGLTMMAEQSAGVSIPRTSQQQWADLPHVPASQAGPGDLALFVGSDGTWTAPGHVAIVINHHGGIVEAYGTGVPVRYSTDHRSDLVGFVKP